MIAYNFCTKVLRNSQFFKTDKNPDAPLKGTFTPGGLKTDKLVVVTGENGAGKSFLRRLIIAYKRKDFHAVEISQEGRKSYMATLKYGLEEIFPTSLNSVHVSQRIFTQKSEQRQVLILDEPEIGMSEETAAMMGDILADAIKAAGDNIAAVFVITHSRALVQQLLLRGIPHHFQVGEKTYPSLNAWLTRTIVPESLPALEARTTETKDKILKLLK